MIGLLAFALFMHPPETPARVAEGRWGGTGISLEVTAEGARIELDCAHGTIDAPLVLDAAGRFELPGTLVRERPGPVRMGETEKPDAVRWAGRLEGGTLTIQLLHPSAPRTPAPLSLELGRVPRLRKCG